MEFIVCLYVFYFIMTSFFIILMYMMLDSYVVGKKLEKLREEERKDGKRKVDTGCDKETRCSTQGVGSPNGKENPKGKAEGSGGCWGQGGEAGTIGGDVGKVEEKEMKWKSFKDEMPVDGQPINLCMYDFPGRTGWHIYSGKFSKEVHDKTSTPYMDRTTYWSELFIPNFIPEEPPVEDTKSEVQYVQTPEIKQEVGESKEEVQGMPEVVPVV